MKNWVIAFGIMVMSLVSCGEFTAVQKIDDFDYRYEVAKANFADGHFGKAATLLTDLVSVMKNSQNGEECMYMLALSEFNNRDYESASSYFKKYFQSFPRGYYVEAARYYSALSLYKQIPDPRLDQSDTQAAIREFQSFVDVYPYSRFRESAQSFINEMMDLLVEKEYLAAKLYYDLGDYVNNCAYGGSNYEACVVTAQNALKDYPYASASLREELSILTLRARYQLARQSVEEKLVERFRDTIDEYYAFVNDFPESKYMKEAKDIFTTSENAINKRGFQTIDND